MCVCLCKRDYIDLVLEEKEEKEKEEKEEKKQQLNSYSTIVIIRSV